MPEFSLQKYLESHHQITELALSLIAMGLEQKNYLGAKRALENARRQIAEEALGNEKTIQRWMRDTFPTKVVTIERKPKR